MIVLYINTELCRAWGWELVCTFCCRILSSSGKVSIRDLRSLSLSAVKVTKWQSKDLDSNPLRTVSEYEGWPFSKLGVTYL